MKKRSSPQKRPTPLTRLSFPFDEARLEWLPMLLDAYAIADQGVHTAIRRRENQGHQLACAKGCSHCCRSHTTIPVFPLELIGVYWFAIEKISDPLRTRLVENLKSHQPGQPCPFLVENICAIHAMRFLACRHFNVFSQACEEGEDAFYTRRHDVLTPIRDYQNRALEQMLPFHDIKKKSERRHAIKTGYLQSQVKVLQEIDWKKLADRMTS